MDWLIFSPSGALTSSVYRNERNDLGLLFVVASPSVSTTLILQTAVDSAGPFYDLNKADSPAPFVVASGQLAQVGVASVPGLQYLRLRSSTAIAPTSIGLSFSRRP